MRKIKHKMAEAQKDKHKCPKDLLLIEYEFWGI